MDVVTTQPSITIGTMLRDDSVKVSASKGYPAPYDKGDVRALKKHFQRATFGDIIDIGGIGVELHSAGHIPGAAMFKVNSKRSALFTGDSFHHPIQVAFPDWGTGVDTDMTMSSASRRKTLERLADTDTYMLAAHFMEPTAAHVVTSGDEWKLKVQEN